MKNDKLIIYFYKIVINYLEYCKNVTQTCPPPFPIKTWRSICTSPLMVRMKLVAAVVEWIQTGWDTGSRWHHREWALNLREFLLKLGWLDFAKGKCTDRNYMQIVVPRTFSFFLSLFSSKNVMFYKRGGFGACGNQGLFIWACFVLRRTWEVFIGAIFVLDIDCVGVLLTFHCHGHDVVKCPVRYCIQKDIW